MNKATEIQRSKVFSSYGGAGSSIDTIDNLAYIIEPFNNWRIYDTVQNNPLPNRHLLLQEERLIQRLHSVGFTNLNEFFVLDDFVGEQVRTFAPTANQEQRMVTSSFFPRWFYCSRCQRFQTIDDWKALHNVGTRKDYARRGIRLLIDEKFDNNIPSCPYCNSQGRNGGLHRAPLQQIRFVLASMETGEIKDIPWDQVFDKRGRSDEPTASVWNFHPNSPRSQEVYFFMSKNSSDLYGIHVYDEQRRQVNMAEIMQRYFVITENGNTTVYKPVIRNANNVYFAYNLSSVFIPIHQITVEDIRQIQNYADTINRLLQRCGMPSVNPRPEDIKAACNSRLSLREIKAILDTATSPGVGYRIPAPLSYPNEDMFRLDEYDFFTDSTNYPNGEYQSEELESKIYPEWPERPQFIRNLYFQRKLTITTVQPAYSRIDKISPNYLASWKGRSESPKEWYDANLKMISKDIEVKLHSTCDVSVETITRMPAVQATGEGFFVELDLSSIPNNGNTREVFMHTFSHLIMKELEFSCGYPIASMNERLFYLPKEITNANDNKYGFLIYSANGEAGSYGGITSLFQSDKIQQIIKQAVFLAEDCPNDPVCENERGHCFACVDIPETTCEKFNSNLNRRIFQIFSGLNNYHNTITAQGQNSLAPIITLANYPKLKVIVGDLTTLKVDAIVNAANERLNGGGGIDGAIHLAAGPQLLDECLSLGGCETGQSKLTRAYNLPCRYIIHTVGPRWNNGTNPNAADLLKSCYDSCFDLLNQNNLKSIAFCCISTGIFGYPKYQAAQIALNSIKEHFDNGFDGEVTICCYTNADKEPYDALIN